jgi:hypothetical protein
MIVLATILCALGTYVAAVNFYLYWLRLPIHLRRGGTAETLKHVSVIPILGSCFLWIAARLYRDEHPILMWVAIAISCCDVGGLPWVPFFLIRISWQGDKRPSIKKNGSGPIA